MIWQTVIYVLVFASGAALMGFEILGVRMIAPYFGDSTLIWASVISVFLAALAAGNFCGGRIADRWPSVHTLAIVLLASALLFVLEPVIAGPVCRAIVARRFGRRIDPLLAATVLFFLPTLCLGAITPLIIRLRIPSTLRAGSTAGSVYSLSTAGSIFGALFTAFYLIERFGVRAIVMLWGAALCVMSAVAFIGRNKVTRAAMLAMLCVVTAYPATAQRRVQFKRDTLYHRIVVEDRGTQRLLRFDADWQSTMSLRNPLEGQFEYVDFFHAALAFNPDLRSVLFIGLGGGSGPRRFRHDYPEVQIDVVEIDPVVVDVAKKFFYFKEDAKLKVVVEDGRVYLQRTPKTYDLIVMDAYASSAYGAHIPFHLATQEFFALARKRMSKRGVIMYNVIGSTRGRDSRPVRSIYRTMQVQFPGICYFPAATSRNVVICATTIPQKDMPTSLVPTARKLVDDKTVSLPSFLRRIGQYSTSPMATADVPLLTDDFAPINNLLR